MNAFLILISCSAALADPTVELRHDEAAAAMVVVVDGRDVLAYQYGAGFALPHYWPVRSPSGQLLTEQHPDPFPHHRSLWIADKVKAGGGPVVDFYHCWQNYHQKDQPESGFQHFIRHLQFGELKANECEAMIEAQLRWIVNDDRPVLDDHRTLRVVALGDGEYLLDLKWELKASYGDVEFVSDRVHYAWPYVRIHPQFSGESGGVMTTDRGATGQKATDGKVAKWIDYSNTVEGTTEGLALFIYPDGQEHDWLTREYGTFGPRRAASLSGTGFTLKANETLPGRVGILVHRGDVTTGRVAERYEQYIGAGS